MAAVGPTAAFGSRTSGRSGSHGAARTSPAGGVHQVYRHNSKFDLEDLPTTWGGYDKLPLRARLFHTMGRPLVAMSGKFHTMWGEFGGFKHRDAMRYEAACMIANGCCANFGDPMLDVALPSAGRVTLLHQPHANRHVVHLTYACPMKRGRCEIIEDIVPLFDIPLAVRLPTPPTRAYLAPSHETLALTRGRDGAISVVVPRLECHAAVVFEPGRK